ncbi:MAG: hypothetical protein H6729_17795 [Deltaproteobacteria bacterium]|nr:hypothetical protein [Deltaproteobacteria bacterium]
MLAAAKTRAQWAEATVRTRKTHIPTLAESLAPHALGTQSDALSATFAAGARDAFRSELQLAEKPGLLSERIAELEGQCRRVLEPAVPDQEDRPKDTRRAFAREIAMLAGRIVGLAGTLENVEDVRIALGAAIPAFALAREAIESTPPKENDALD